MSIASKLPWVPYVRNRMLDPTRSRNRMAFVLNMNVREILYALPPIFEFEHKLQSRGIEMDVWIPPFPDEVDVFCKLRIARNRHIEDIPLSMEWSETSLYFSDNEFELFLIELRRSYGEKRVRRYSYLDSSNPREFMYQKIGLNTSGITESIRDFIQLQSFLPKDRLECKFLQGIGMGRLNYVFLFPRVFNEYGLTEKYWVQFAEKIKNASYMQIAFPKSQLISSALVESLKEIGCYQIPSSKAWTTMKYLATCSFYVGVEGWMSHIAGMFQKGLFVYYRKFTDEPYLFFKNARYHEIQKDHGIDQEYTDFLHLS